MAKRLKINDASAQLKDFLRQLDVKKGEYVLEVTGEPLVGIIPLWQVEKLSQRREEILALLETKLETELHRGRSRDQTICERSDRRDSCA
jgi:hypothetical protein